MSHRTHPHASDDATERARTLRKNSTWPERVLWSWLRARRLADLKFRRQVPVGPFVVDFLCEAAALVVELDGESHVGQGEADGRRTAFLQSFGLRVIRVTNDDVLSNIDAVLNLIVRVALNPVSGASQLEQALTPRPSPEGRGSKAWN